MIRRTLLVAALGAFALLAIAASASAQAVGSITGLVTDQQSGQPLEGVQVYVPQLNRGTLTQSNGRYFIINVPVGTYSVEARMIGYATVRYENVVVATDITRQVNLQMVSEAVAVEEVIVTAERVPLIELTAAGSQNTVTSEELSALPVTSISGALSLQQGFLEVPQNTDVLSLGEVRRNVISPVRIRGGRGGETLTLIDGIPVNNWVLGGRSFDLNVTAVEQVDLLKGGLEPQYGNALSGVVNITTREGGAEPQGWLEMRSSRVAGELLGWTPSELEDRMQVQGSVSGTLPFIPGDRLRFALSGSQGSARADVFEFDNDVFIPSNPQASTAHELDVFPGWRAFGFDEERDLFGKLTFQVTPATKLNFTAIDYQRQYQPFDFRYLLTYDNPLNSPIIATAEDSAAYIINTLGLLGVPLSYSTVVVNTAELNRRLYVAAVDQTFSRGFVRAAFGRFDQDRQTCNWFQGVCLKERFQERSFDTGFVIAAPAGKLGQNPTGGTDDVFGGEDLRSYVARADVQWQVSDHHNLQGGVFYQNHDIDYFEFENLNINNTQGIQNEYHVQPWEGAFYLQDRI
ncbi:MAG: carboxypeptidase regulatory-like domain-containing protein, partial [Gemmatimonadetes bacterium]|nr:carboxypeptidase regulatory-like domain-containing protein [Gemmatimonadota bacterium]